MFSKRLVAIVLAVCIASLLVPSAASALTVSQRLSRLEKKVSALQTANTALKARVKTLEACNVMKLNPYVGVAGSYHGLKGPRIVFAKTNVEILNGSGETNSANGLGNLVIGYDEMRTSTETSRTGSHNLVVGAQHKFTSYGGLVAGNWNELSAPYASIAGGDDNTVSARVGSVSGGFLNKVTYERASVGGGYSNLASGYLSSVSGGSNNTASGARSCVSGGHLVTATLDNSWAGGTYHTP